jgi:hypothetical protein
MLVMVSGVTLLMVDLRVSRWAWVVVDSREQYRTCSVVSRQSLQRGHRMKSTLLIVQR